MYIVPEMEEVVYVCISWLTSVLIVQKTFALVGIKETWAYIVCLEC
jgi:hypothetical protein